MRVFYFLAYNFFFLPPFIAALHLASLFHAKLRQGITGRYNIHRTLRKSGLLKKHRPVVVVHCASMGEFEHIKPFLVEFRKKRPNFAVIVLFFSPSGFENVKQFEAVDLFLYSPFDWVLPVWRFIRKVKPALWVVAKHDVWPNQVWLTRLLGIPLLLINASLHQQSSRLLWFTRPFHRSLYQCFNKILTVSETDWNNFCHLVDDSRLLVAGDTKFDQVVYRRKESARRRIIPPAIVKDRFVLVAGSTWPEDHRHLIPAVRRLSAKYPELFTIICPHEPTRDHLQEVRKRLSPLPSCLLSEIDNYRGEPVVVVDRIGVLANLYSLGNVAYVGGSFRQNIHNVLEPAVFEIPVLFGPVNQNSHEAQLLKAEGGAVQITSSGEIENALLKFILNSIYCRETGRRAYRVVETHCGATAKTVETVLSFL